jgi:hypothetical protein
LHYFGEEKIAKPLINKAIDDFFNMAGMVAWQYFYKYI